MNVIVLWSDEVEEMETKTLRKMPSYRTSPDRGCDLL